MNQTILPQDGMLDQIVAFTTVAMLGMKKSGKTFGAAIAERNIKKKTFIFDTVGAFTEMKLVSNALFIKDIKIANKEMVRKLLDKCYAAPQKTVVLYVFGFSRKDLVDLANMFSEWALQKGNMAVIFDEVGDYLSQTKEVYADELERMIRWGRNKNIQPILLLSQRPQKVNKEALALSDAYVVFRLYHPLDRAKIKDLTGDESDMFDNKVKTLPVRHTIIFTIDNPVPVDFVFPELKL